MLLVLMAYLVLAPGTARSSHFFVCHGVAGGSHIMNMHHISKSLVNRGHRVTTVTLEDVMHPKIPGLGKNHSHFMVSVDNSDGTIPFFTKGPEAKFRLPQEFLWSAGSNFQLLLRDVLRIGIDPMVEGLYKGFRRHAQLQKHLAENKVSPTIKHSATKPPPVSSRSMLPSLTCSSTRSVS